jgi:hypothetical protein
MKVSLAKLCCLISALATATVHSQTLNWASLTGSEIVNSHGSPLDGAYVFQVGAFTDGFVPLASNFESWKSEWRVFDTADYSYSPEGLGYFTGTEDVQNVAAYSSMFAGLKAYIWIRSETDGEHFLASTSSDTWRFPLLVPGCCPNGEGPTWSISDLNSDDPVWGGQLGNEGGGSHSVSGSFDIQTYTIPETGSSLLALVSLALAITRRRRNPA